MALSDKGILRCMEEGRIVIDPFMREHLSTSSYDVTLGPYYFRQATPEAGASSIYNFWSEDDVNKVWGEPLLAENMQEWCSRHKIPALKGIKPTDEVIWIGPNETILAHTNEFIGGRVNVTTMMKARSSMGRNFIEVCKCAEWTSKTLTAYFEEITNNSRSFSIPLIVGRRIAQIIFFETEGIVDASYTESGKYQTGSDLEALKAKWNPRDCLPRCYMDKEAREANQKIQRML